MRADNSHYVIDAAHRRSAATRKRAVAALRRMDTTGIPVNFDAVAREADVSRSWLYNEPDLRAEIERLRARQRPTTTTSAVPDRQRASNASLLRRLEATTERNRQLEAENQQLREAVARLVGEARAADTSGTSNDTRKRKKVRAMIGPCS